MPDYEKGQKEYTRLKARLTRVKNKMKENPQAVIKEVAYAQKIFEDVGFPDQWNNWVRAAEDAGTQIRFAKVDSVSYRG